LYIGIDNKTEKWMIEVRRHLHRYPETSFKEYNTQRKIIEELTRLGIETKKIADTGVIGTIHGGQDGNTIALRADMDALNIEEQETELNHEYRSSNKGVMHACGHDGHMAMVLGAARILQKLKDKLVGNIKLIFQPGEETPPGGALDVIRDGGLEGVNAILGIHLMGDIDSGKIGFRTGKMMAHQRVFKISIIGKSGHHLNPNHCIDPIVIASDFISSIKTELIQHMDSMHPFVFGLGTINGGTIINQTPEDVRITGTFRTFSSEEAIKIESIMREKLDALMRSYKKENINNVPYYDLEIIPGYPVLTNNEKFTRRAASILESNFPEVNRDVELNFGAEDFAYYLENIPGMFMFLGIRNPKKRVVNVNHSNRFDLDESVLKTGVMIYVTLCLDFLENHNEYTGDTFIDE
jgi:amidohydrolase